MTNKEKEQFTFAISLSVLNHLGRNLYRNFITVLGEAISNSWDADAKNVRIYIDRDTRTLVVKDDGVGMTSDDFKEKFLKVGYSKRKNGDMKSPEGRPFIGAKGIGKLALLSSADTISIISKTAETEYVGGVIDNSELDKKIKDDLEPSNYPLGELDMGLFADYTVSHDKGTIIYFENIKEDIRNTVDYLRKMIALHFRFSLIDPEFNIFVEDTLVSAADLKDLIEATEFTWNINSFSDDFTEKIKKLKEEPSKINIESPKINGFIASVNKPRQLKISGTEEKAGIDLFVNGRLREKNILKNLVDFSTRHIASYLYGQIYFDGLDNDLEGKAFTTSREEVVVDNSDYKELLDILKKSILKQVGDEWDIFRRKHKQDWDIDNGKMPRYKAKMEQSKNEREKDFKMKIEENIEDVEIKKRMKDRLDKLSSKNTGIYQDLFILENLFREYIKIKNISLEDLKSNTDKNIEDCVKKINSTQKDRAEDEARHSLGGKMVQNEHYTNYIDFVYLGILIDLVIDKKDEKISRYQLPLESDAKEIVPIRNLIMHTNEVTDEVVGWSKIKKIIDYMDSLV